MSAARLIPVDDSTPVSTLDAAPCVLVIGNFDGVHRGHQAVLEQAVAFSDASPQWSTCALTFAPHPSEVVGPGAPRLLTSLDERAHLMGALGVRRLYVRRFDAEFAAWSPERFARDLVAGALRAKVVVVGGNFRFGSRRTGDLARLRSLGQALGFDVRTHAVACDRIGPYSSTRARDAVAAGDLPSVLAVLGRPHSVSGTVGHGQARGRQIGFATANLEGIAEMLPPNGVYAVRVERERPPGAGREPLADGVTNIGVRPTVSGSGERSVETHLFDFSDDLYGSRLRVHFWARLRDEKKFTSLDELRAQIARDADSARATLAAFALAPATQAPERPTP